ncbi:threonine/serine exporter family protein [Anaeropeptidivorans aminofermentans]|jgi:uncharacterized membrane protein YjjP (DUF1212 family)|uniref:threonine/serine exporter family protein n=1 Tax=Anaeropeptidivorans aminofermentans TaxID=2934315 RepID=UPI00202543BE|nr:threonine/serine exporter family protein [Anaeropeptidivorans aminofermentans]MBE6011985.1 threonine/serine exporter family protein [Lachnospiraceae bacterium]
MDSQKILKFVIDSGAVMLQNGAETTRVEDTMIRLLKIYAFKENDVFATPTGIFGSIVDDNGNIITMVRRINTRTINLEKVALINNLSRNLVSEQISIDAAIIQLNLISNKPSYKNLYKYFASGISSGCFAFIFGGSFFDALNAFITGFLLYVFLIFLEKHSVIGPVTNIMGGAFVSMAAVIINHMGLGDSTDMSIIGSIMPLVPGVAFTNAVRDIIFGEYISGTTRMIDAVLVAVCVATGVGIGLGIIFYAIGALSLWS